MNLNKTSLRAAKLQRSNYRWYFYAIILHLQQRPDFDSFVSLVGDFWSSGLETHSCLSRWKKSCIILYSWCLAEFKTIGLFRNLYPLQRHANFPDLICFTVQCACMLIWNPIYDEYCWTQIRFLCDIVCRSKDIN